MHLRCLVGVLPTLALGCLAEPEWGQAARSIRDGSETDAHPAVAALFEESSFRCSGTLIAPQAVLTAGHCITELNPQATLHVFFGTNAWDASSPGFLGWYVVTDTWIPGRWAQPSSWEDSFGADIGLLFLEEFVPIEPLPIGRSGLGNPSAAVLVGWGKTSPNERDGGVKRTGTVAIRRDVEEVPPAREAEVLGFRAAPAGACEGDSGGPMLIGETVVGVISKSDNICDFGFGTRVHPWAAEIDAEIGRRFGSPPAGGSDEILGGDEGPCGCGPPCSVVSSSRDGGPWVLGLALIVGCALLRRQQLRPSARAS